LRVIGESGIGYSFREDQPVDTGGHGAVFRARDDRGNVRAIKRVLSPDRRLDREYALRSELPAVLDAVVVPFLDQGEDDAGRHFVVMPWYEQNLWAWTHGKPLEARLLALARAADALSLFQQHSSAEHKDIKPNNLMVDEHGAVLLADLGGARLFEGGPALTNTGTITPEYAAPELRLRLILSPDRSRDTFALAATIFACLAGGPPRGAQEAWTRLSVAGSELDTLSRQPRRTPAEEAELDRLKRGTPVGELLDVASIRALNTSDCDRLRSRLRAGLVGRVAGVDAVVESLAQALQDALSMAMHPDPRQRAADPRSLGLVCRLAGGLLERMVVAGEERQVAVPSAPVGETVDPVRLKAEPQKAPEPPVEEKPSPAPPVPIPLPDAPQPRRASVVRPPPQVLPPESDEIADLGPDPDPDPAPADAEAIAVDPLALHDLPDDRDVIRPRSRLPMMFGGLALTGGLMAGLVAMCGLLSTRLNIPSAGEVREFGGVDFAYIPAGRFTMGCTAEQGSCDGDEKPVHEVELSRGFWLQTTEVTQGQWLLALGETPAGGKDYKGVSLEGKDFPVVYVSWLDAVRFANALSAKQGLESCYVIDGEDVSWPKGLDCAGYRLPTESEWEYAARAGGTSVYAGTSSTSEMCRYGNVNSPSVKEKFGWSWDAFPCADGHTTLAPVGSFEANGWGLYDMSGNVWEWCWDVYGEYPTNASVDPLGASTGSDRVARGGSWYSNPAYVRVALRYGITPSGSYDALGLRLARSL
jgi:formylglycine-generating enzyme required for sulfatase activity/serine/threonine protein kinase